MKQLACAKVGVASELIHLPENISQAALLDVLNELNTRDDVDSILTQVSIHRPLKWIYVTPYSLHFS